jgi:hypothetical protein
MPHYIAARIRQCPPLAVRVVSESTPVVSFGDVRQATVATLGWNPSKLEFISRSGELLRGDERRLETATSLKMHGILADSPDGVNKVFEGCNTYFHRRPYRRWFDVLEKVLRHIGLSYYDGSACHLDLVQWSTDPVWNGLESRETEVLLNADIPFLRQQLAQEHIRLLLLNGRGIVRAYEEHLGNHLRTVAFPSGGRIEVYCARATPNLMVIGWNINLQSSFGVSNAEIGMIAQQVKQIANL